MDDSGKYDDLLQRVREMQLERGMGATEAAATVWLASGRTGSIREFSRLVLTKCVLQNEEGEVPRPTEKLTDRQNEASNTEQINTSNSKTVNVEVNDTDLTIKINKYEHSHLRFPTKGLENNKTDSEVNDKSKKTYNRDYEQNIGKPDQKVITVCPKHHSKGPLKVRFCADDDICFYCLTETEPEEYVNDFDEESAGAEPQLSPKVLALAATLSGKLEGLRADDADLVAAKMDQLRATMNKSTCSPAAIQVIAEDVLAMERAAERHHRERSGQRVEVDAAVLLEELVRGTAHTLRVFLETFPEREELTAKLTRILVRALEEEDEEQIELATTRINELLLESTDESARPERSTD